MTTSARRWAFSAPTVRFGTLEIVRFLVIFVFAFSLAAQVRFVPQNSGVTASLRGLATVGEQTAWASGTGGTILLTTDGGASWRRRPVPGAEALDFRDLAAFSERQAFALTSGEGEKSRIYKTTDGGASWQLLKTNSDPKGFWDAIAFSDPKHGVLMGDSVNGRVVIETTTDGGVTWLRRKTPPALPGEGGFAASGTCLVVRGKREIWFGTVAARVFRSQNGGATWTVSETPLRQADPTAGIFSLAVGLRGALLAVGGDYRKPEQATQVLSRSSDGGKSWIIGSGPRGFRSAAIFLNPKLVIAVGTSGADLSRDGGGTWEPVDAAGYNAIQPGWAVGPEGRIARVIVQ